MPDSHNVISSLKEFPDQCEQIIRDIHTASIPESCFLVDNIIVSGMGGSALGARVLQALDTQLITKPLTISTEYRLPQFADKKTLVIISSYSGNTEETLSSLEDAQARGCQIYIVCTGGKLASIAKDKGLPYYLINPIHNPSSQPRMALGYSILVIYSLLSRCKLIHSQDNLSDLPRYLRDSQSDLSKYSSAAQHFSGKIPVLVGSEHLRGSLHAFRNQLHENAKTFSVYFDIPELNHHLLEGLTYPKSNPDNLIFQFVTSKLYSPKIQSRYPLTESVVNKNNIEYFEFPVTGPSKFFESIDLVQGGAYIAYYLSQINGVDPGPIPWVDWYKDEIRKVV